MLRKKMFRDILQNKSQFITIFLMILIGVMVYVGIEAYMNGMTKTAETFYSENNLQDLNVLGSNFTKDDIVKIKNMDNVNNAELKLMVTGIDADNKDKTYSINFIESNEISKFYVISGEPFSYEKKGAWIDNFYAEKNNLKIGDIIKIKYDTLVLEEPILGYINVPDHLYDTKDESELVPDRSTFGFVYVSANEIPESYIKDIVMKNLNISDIHIFDTYMQNFDYKKYIPYNCIMVDVDSKDNVQKVKNEIESNINNVITSVKIEDTSSYAMYQGEIDEGEAYIGIFSGLFLFIAMLSVITTMTRIVKNQKIQIGTMKALGFGKKAIFIHYISYGFWISLIASICGILLGRFFIGSVFLNMEMSFFEIPNGVPVIDIKSYLVACLVVLVTSFITYLTCLKELKKVPAEALRNELPKVKNADLKITKARIFKNLNFSTKWNIRDILRNKFRTITGVIGIVGCCTLIVCAFGMLNSMNYFIELQFNELYNFEYKLTLKENISKDDLNKLKETYGDCTSQTLGIEICQKDDSSIKKSNTAFVTDAKDLVRFKDENGNYTKIDQDDGIFITYKLAENEGYKLGDTISWHILGSDTYYTSKIVGFNKDPQNQNITMSRKYLESLGAQYTPDSLYTNSNLKGIKEIDNVSLIQDISDLKQSMASMLSMTKEMITLVIVFAVLLGAVIIYNMGVLSYGEKQYQFATLKVLGFKDKNVKNIFIKQNIWITILSIILGLPAGYFLVSWLFKECLNDNFDFEVHIKLLTYIIAALGTFLVSYLVSKFLAKKVNSIDMVSSLKANE